MSDGEHSLQGLAEYNDAHVWGVFTRLGLAVREGADQTRGALGAMEEERLSQVLEPPCSFSRPVCAAKGPVGMETSQILADVGIPAGGRRGGEGAAGWSQLLKRGLF